MTGLFNSVNGQIQSLKTIQYKVGFLIKRD